MKPSLSAQLVAGATNWAARPTRDAPNKDARVSETGALIQIKKCRERCLDLSKMAVAVRL
jgi:hypothetical protein